MTEVQDARNVALAVNRDVGRVVLVATPIGNLGDMGSRAIATLQHADWIYAEDTRHSRPLLTHFGISSERVRPLHEHNEATVANQIVELARAGAVIAYISDAGMPGVSDPGERLVAACANAGVIVECIPGASAVLAAVVLSGLPTVPFTFYGFIDRKGADRKEQLRLIATATSTSVLFESVVDLGRPGGYAEAPIAQVVALPPLS